MPHTSPQPATLRVAIPVLNGLVLLSLFLTWYIDTDEPLRRSGMGLLFNSKLFGAESTTSGINSGATSSWLIIATVLISSVMFTKVQWYKGLRALAAISVSVLTLVVVALHLRMMDRAASPEFGDGTVIAGDGSTVALWTLILLTLAWIEHAWQPRLSKHFVRD